MPATDGSVAAHIHGLRRRGASRSSPAAIVSALAWRGRVQGMMPTDALLADCVAKLLGTGRSASSAANYVSAAVWWAKRNGRPTPKGLLT